MSGCFIADDESSEVVEPTVGAFDFVTSLIALKGSAILSGFLFSTAAMGTDKFNAAFFHETLSQWIAVGGFVIQKMLGGTIRHLNLVEGWLNQIHFALRSGRDIDSDGRPMSVNDVHDFGTFAALGISHAVAPFLALANQASAAASFQSILPRASSSLSSSAQIASNSPSDVHSSKRLQQVLPDG